MKMYLIQAKLGTQWLNCYRFNNLPAAEDQLARMNNEYDRSHRIVESK